MRVQNKGALIGLAALLIGLAGAIVAAVLVNV